MFVPWEQVVTLDSECKFTFMYLILLPSAQNLSKGTGKNLHAYINIGYPMVCGSMSLRGCFQSGSRKFCTHQICQCVVPDRGWVRDATFRTVLRDGGETVPLQDILHRAKENLIKGRLSLFWGLYLGQYIIQKLWKVKKLDIKHNNYFIPNAQDALLLI